MPVNTFGRADTVHVKGEHRPTDRDYFAYFGLMSLFKAHGYNQAGIIERSPFLLQDVLFNSLLVVSMRSLAHLFEALADMDLPGGQNVDDSLRERGARSTELADKVASAIRVSSGTRAADSSTASMVEGSYSCALPTVQASFPSWVA